MLKFNKDFNAKIISLFVAVSFLLNSTVYGIDLPRYTPPNKLRVPVGEKSTYNQIKEATQQVFNRRYSTGAQLYEEGDAIIERKWFRPELFVYDEIKEALGNGDFSQLTVLNLGCGDGLKGGAVGSTWLVKQGVKSIQVDFAESAIKIFKGLLNETELARTEFMTSDYMVALKDILENRGENSIDIVVAHLALNWLSIEETEAIFRIIGRILKPGGKFIFKVMSDDEKALNEARSQNLDVPIGWKRIEREGDFFTKPGGETVRYYSEKFASALLEKARLTQISLVKMNPISGFDNRPLIVVAMKSIFSSVDTCRNLREAATSM